MHFFVASAGLSRRWFILIIPSGKFLETGHDVSLTNPLQCMLYYYSLITLDSEQPVLFTIRSLTAEGLGATKPFRGSEDVNLILPPSTALLCSALLCSALLCENSFPAGELSQCLFTPDDRFN
jgi:hypothetical protein